MDENVMTSTVRRPSSQRARSHRNVRNERSYKNKKKKGGKEQLPKIPRTKMRVACDCILFFTALLVIAAVVLWFTDRKTVGAGVEEYIGRWNMVSFLIEGIQSLITFIQLMVGGGFTPEMIPQIMTDLIPLYGMVIVGVLEALFLIFGLIFVIMAFCKKDSYRLSKAVSGILCRTMNMYFVILFLCAVSSGAGETYYYSGFVPGIGMTLGLIGGAAVVLFVSFLGRFGSKRKRVSAATEAAETAESAEENAALESERAAVDLLPDRKTANKTWRHLFVFVIGGIVVLILTFMLNYTAGVGRFESSLFSIFYGIAASEGQFVLPNLPYLIMETFLLCAAPFFYARMNGKVRWALVYLGDMGDNVPHLEEKKQEKYNRRIDKLLTPHGGMFPVIIAALIYAAICVALMFPMLGCGTSLGDFMIFVAIFAVASVFHIVIRAFGGLQPLDKKIKKKKKKAK